MLHYFNVILFRISPLMLHYFNALAFGVAPFEFALFNVALCQCSAILRCTINLRLF